MSAQQDQITKLSHVWADWMMELCPHLNSRGRRAACVECRRDFQLQIRVALDELMLCEAAPDFQELVDHFVSDVKNGYGIELRQVDQDYLFTLFLTLNRNISNAADCVIQEARKTLENLRHLADGDDCTLKDLKYAVAVYDAAHCGRKPK